MRLNQLVVALKPELVLGLCHLLSPKISSSYGARTSPSLRVRSMRIYSPSDDTVWRAWSARLGANLIGAFAIEIPDHTESTVGEKQDVECVHFEDLENTNAPAY